MSSSSTKCVAHSYCYDSQAQIQHGGGGPVTLTGDVNGPSGANVVDSITPTSGTLDFTGDLNLHPFGGAVSSISFFDTDASHFVGFVATGVTTTSYTMTLPAAPGANGEILAIASGGGGATPVLAWVANGAAPVLAGDVNGLAGANVVDSATPTTGTLPITGNTQIRPFGGAASSLTLYDDNASNFSGFKSPTNVTSNYILTMPAAPGANGELLSITSGGGTAAPVFAWTAASALITLAGDVDGAPGANVLNSATPATGALPITGTAEVRPFGGAAQSLTLYDDNASNFVGMKSAANTTTTYTMTFPAAPGANNELLTITSGGGTASPVLAWTAATGLVTLAGDVDGPAGANVVNSATPATGALPITGTAEVRPFGGAAQSLTLYDDNASNFVGMKSATNTTTTYTMTFPAAPGANGEILAVASGGGTAAPVLAWVANGGAVALVGDVNGPAGANVADSATPTSGTYPITGDTEIRPFGAAASPVRLYDDNASNFVGFVAAGTTTSNYTLTMPAAPGTDGQLLNIDSGGGGATPVLQWVTASTLVTLAGDVNGAPGSNVVDSATPTSGTLPITADTEIRPFGGAASPVRLYDDNASNFAGFVAAGTTTSDYTMTLPAAPGANNEILSITSGGGTAAPILAWTAATGLVTLAGDVDGAAGANVVNSATPAAGALPIAGTAEVRPFGGAASSLTLYDDNASNFVGMKSAANTTTTYTLTMPAAPGANGEVLAITSGGGTASPVYAWLAPSGAVTLAGDVNGPAGANVADSATPTSGTFPITGDTEIRPFGGAASPVRLYDDNASNFVGFVAAGTTTSDYTMTLPAAAGANGDVLSIASGGGGASPVLQWGPVAGVTDWKQSARVATTANITLAGAQTIDGISAVAGDRVLVKNQTTGGDNGIYTVVDPGAWTRTTDADVSADVTSGLAIVVEEGVANGQKLFILTTANPITLGTTALTFEPRGGREGTSYTLQGQGAFSAITSGLRGVAIGRDAAFSVTTQNDVTAVGFNALRLNTGSTNTAFGSLALDANTSGTANVGVGVNALGGNTTASQNVGVGNNTLLSNSTGTRNVSVGHAAAQNFQDSDQVAIGHEALLTNGLIPGQVAVGAAALRLSNLVSTAANVAVGYHAMTLATTGSGNVSVGMDSLSTLTTGGSNVAVGFQSLLGCITGGNNVAIGTMSLLTNTASNNTAVGDVSLGSNTSGTSNVAIGRSALFSSTTGDQNTAVGVGAAALQTIGISNTTAIGYNALNNNDAQGNTAVGASALAANTTAINVTAVGLSALAANNGSGNTAVGSLCLDANTSGTNNTAVGLNALGANTSGTQNTAVGAGALAANVGAVSNNTAVGYNSLTLNSSGTSNTAVGVTSLAANTSGTGNVAVGSASLNAASTLSNLVAVGTSALAQITSGAGNTAVGNNAMTSTTTGSNNTAVGSGAMSTTAGASQCIAIGTSTLAAVTGANNIAIGHQCQDVTTSGTDNIGMGTSALGANTTGTGNVAIGSAALNASVTLGNLVAIGTSALAQITTGTGNTAVGNNAMASTTTGSSNTVLGSGAMATTAGASQCIAIGTSALAAVTGSNNVAIGHQSQDVTTSGTDNISVGTSTLGANTTGTGNVAVGSSAMNAAVSLSNFVAVGTSALAQITSGTNNTAVGNNAATSMTSGSNNTAIGFNAMATTAGASTCTAVGSGALQAATGADNVGIGYLAGTAMTSGSQNVAVGRSALAANTTAAANTAVGDNALAANTTAAAGANSNTAIGANSMAANTDGGGNTALGAQSLDANTTGDDNTALGYQALTANNTGGTNVAVGTMAMAANTSGGGNVAVGVNALATNSTGGVNVAIGNSALSLNTTASSNVAVGESAMATNSTGTQNVAVGYQALDANTTANNNTAIGYGALTTNSTGAGNTAVGASAGALLTTASNNTAIGHLALDAASTAANCTAVGQDALGGVTTGGGNTGMGLSAGAAITTGTNNVCIGSATGATLTTGGQNTLIGMGTDVDAAGAAGRIAIGRSAAGNSASAATDDGLYFHDALDDLALDLSVTYNTTTGQMGPVTSSKRFKTDIVPIESNTENIYDLRAVTYTRVKGGAREFGFIAEEVAEVLPELVSLDKQRAPYGVKYMMLSVLMLEEMKKLRERIRELEGKLQGK